MKPLWALAALEASSCTLKLRGFWDSLVQPTRPCDGCKSFPSAGACNGSGLQPVPAINGVDHVKGCVKSHMAMPQRRLLSSNHTCSPSDLDSFFQALAMSDILHPQRSMYGPTILCVTCETIGVSSVTNRCPLTMSTKIAAPGSPHGLLVHAELKLLHRQSPASKGQFVSPSPNPYQYSKQSSAYVDCCTASLIGIGDSL